MKITLIENFRALFYAPFYATEALGAYRAEGLDVNMVTHSPSDMTLDVLASGGAEVSWGGPMRIMLAIDKDPASDAVAFCEIVGRDPFFLIGREARTGFSMGDLAGQRLAVVSEVPTPWVCLRRDLHLAGVDAASIALAPARSMAENRAALVAGEVDVIQVFEPYARTLVDEGIGHVWYRAADRGLACYTTLNTTRAFIAKSPDTLLRVTRAIHRTQKWIAAHSGAELAQVVGHYLPDVPRQRLAACFDGYKSSSVWSTSPVVQRAGLEWKRDAMLWCGAIETGLAYEDYVDAQFAEKIVLEDPPSL